MNTLPDSVILGIDALAEILAHDPEIVLVHNPDSAILPRTEHTLIIDQIYDRIAKMYTFVCNQEKNGKQLVKLSRPEKPRLYNQNQHTELPLIVYQRVMNMAMETAACIKPFK